MGRFATWLVLGTVVAAGARGSTAPPLAPAADAVATPSAHPGEQLPVAGVHRYRMAGRIRPLLFWMGRDRVGLARITWREDAAGTVGYELLVGTDPAVAPRGINRWGYIAEERRALDGAVLALMSRSDEGSLEEVDAQRSGPGEGEFRVMHGLVQAGTARAQVSRVRPPATPTINDIDSLLPLVRVEIAHAALRSRALEPVTRPGFLGTVAELIGQTVGAHGGRGGAAAPGTGMSYVFAQSLYRLRVVSTQRVERSIRGRDRPVPAVRARFEITNAATGRQTDFEIVHGTTGALAGVPLFIAWQPRWWLKVELHLED